jgi:DNA segregation ATPase FtsK/SpoIIIE, S-DNA-T family
MSPTANIKTILSGISILILAGFLFKFSKPKSKLIEPAIPDEIPTQTEPEPMPESIVVEVTDANIGFIEAADEERAKSLLAQYRSYDHTLELASYKYPPLDLLNTHTFQLNPSAETLDACKNNIIAVFHSAKGAVEKIRATVGHTMILYEIIPAPGTRATQISRSKMIWRLHWLPK